MLLLLGLGPTSEGGQLRRGYVSSVGRDPLARVAADGGEVTEVLVEGTHG